MRLEGARLGPVQGDLGVAEQVGGDGEIAARDPGARWRDRDAEARPDGDVAPVDCERSRQGGHEALGDQSRARLIRAVEEDGELVPAEPGEGVAGSNRLPEAPAHGRQDLVAHRVTQTLVDDLEAIQVQQQHRDGRRVARPRPGKRPDDAVQEERAIRQRCQRVVVGLAQQALLDGTPLADVADGGRAGGRLVQVGDRPSDELHLCVLAVGEDGQRLEGRLVVNHELRRDRGPHRSREELENGRPAPPARSSDRRGSRMPG